MAHAKSADPSLFILPDLGEGVHEAELISWKVKVGDKVDEHQILAEMETDKALVEVPSPRAGVIAQLHGKEGEILKVGNVLVTYEGGGGGSAKPAAAPARAEAPRAAESHAHSNGKAEEREDAGTVVGSVGGEVAGMSARHGKALATPAVRRIARDLGVDIDSVAGSGMGGRVLERDVREAAQGGSHTKHRPAVAAVEQVAVAPARTAPTQFAMPAPPPKRAASGIAIPAGEGQTRVPFRGVRRTIANRLRQSVDQAVHFNVMDEADVTDLDGLRKKLAGATGEKISFLPFVAAALARVLTSDQFRVLNSTVDEANPEQAEIVTHRALHLGIATDTDNGLMVPVLRDCDSLGVVEIQRHVNAIAKAARDRSIPREQLIGSTFTLSNVGSYAGRFATPIINYPEVGILAVGRATEGMVVRSGWFRVGKLLPLSLACDHRVVDGATAALALAEVVKLLQSPDGLLGPAR